MNQDVQDLLTKKGVEYNESGNDFVVFCLSPDHEDSHPSLRIDKDSGLFHCLSCGFKGDLFSYYNEYRSKTYDLLYEVSNEINNILLETRGLEIPESSVPFSREFRNIKAETYDKFGAFTHSDPEYLNRVIFPIKTVGGLIPAFIGRYTHSNATPKYRVYPSYAKIPIYPIPESSDYVILVEGLFDVINLHDKGVTQASAIFGTHNLTWKTAEDKLAPLLASGISRIVILLDSDSSGKAATRQLTSVLKAKTDCRIIDASGFLPEGMDPGGLDELEVQLLAKYIKKLLDNQA